VRESSSPAVRESSIVVRPQPMESTTYTASSRLQASGLPTGIGLFTRAAENVPLPDAPQPIGVADYGAATGYNSLLPIASAVRVLRGRTRPDHAILVTHSDLPGNDFTALFTTITEDPDSYLTADKATFAAAVGRSFYQQILPPESIVLGWSSWATHWLSRVPAPIGDHIHIAYSADEQARRAYRRQAALDWHDFVAFRGRELAPGGRLVVLTLGLDAAGEPGFGGLMRALLAALRGLVGEGFLAGRELDRMVIPTVGRAEADFVAPFAPSGRLEGLSVEHVELFDAEDLFWSRYLVDGDATRLGAAWGGFARSAIFPTLAAGLDGGVRDPRAAVFVERLESAVAALLRAEPAPMTIPLAAIVLVKRSSA
jgi:hypothetical protein